MSTAQQNEVVQAVASVAWYSVEDQRVRRETMQINMGGLDRGIRIIAGIILIALGILQVIPYAIGIFGAFVLLTGIAGFCILYVPFGISTRK